MPFSLTLEQKQTALWLGLWLALVFILFLLGPILTPFIAAAIFAYVLNPGVDRLSEAHIGKRYLPRSLAVVTVMLLLLAAVMTLILIVVPVLQIEIPLLQNQIPVFLSKLDELLGPKLHDLGINIRLDSASIKKMLAGQFASSGDEIWRAVGASVRVGGTAILGWVAILVLIPVVLFYLLLDWHAILERLKSAVPRRWIGKTVDMAREVDALLAQYLRGQLLVMLILAVYYSITLMIAGFEVALPIGIVTGLLVFVPYVGFGLGLILALIAAVLQFSGLEGLISVAVIYGFGQVLEGFFLTPRLVGERIGLHPLAVIFALLAFAQLFGFVGVLLALPASAILMVVLKHLRRLYLDSIFYKTA